MGSWLSISQVIRHSNYNNVTYENDACLLKLSSSLTLSNSIQPAQLALTFPQQTQNALIAGWGYLTQSGPTTNVLHYGIVQVKSENIVQRLLTTVLDLVAKLLGKTPQASTLFYTVNNDITVCFVSFFKKWYLFL